MKVAAAKSKKNMHINMMGQKGEKNEKNWKLKTDIKYNRHCLIPQRITHTHPAHHCYWHVHWHILYCFVVVVIFGYLNWTFLPHCILPYTCKTHIKISSSMVEIYDILFNWFIVLIYWYMLLMKQYKWQKPLRYSKKRRSGMRK